MEEKILNLLNYSGHSLDYLAIRLDISKDELKLVLENLQKCGLIYLNVHNKYYKVQESHKIGRIQSDFRNHKYVLVKGEKISIEEENLHTALKNDLVVIEMYENNHGNVLGILERKNNRLVCEVISKDNKLKLVPFNAGCEVAITVTNKELLNNFVEGDRVVVTLENTVDETNTIYVFTADGIGHKNDPKSDEIALAISKDFDTFFSDETLKEIALIPNYVREEEKLNRLNLTEEIIFTIDSIHTKDMDDAISISKLYNGNYLLGVHIADVAHYVNYGTNLYKEAMNRATSLYLGDTVIPMIPHKLSNGICSLNEGVERLTKSCFMEINEKGKIVNFKISDTVIKSKKKMTYEELNRLFNGEIVDESYYPFIKELTLMQELSNILTNTKQKRGNVEFASNETKIIQNEEELPIEFVKRSNGEAERIIENFMLAANECVAQYFYWQDLPFIYRVHSIPDEEKLEKTFELIAFLNSNQKKPKHINIDDLNIQKALQKILKRYVGTPEYPIVSGLLLKSMSKAQYSTKNIGHFALALDNYCHFTSPIRRFPDLVVHQLLDKFNSEYKVSNLDEIKQKLQLVSEHSSYKERQADEAERDYLRLKMAEFMESHIGEVFEGTLIDIDHDTAYIHLDNNIYGTIAYTEEFSQAFYIDTYRKCLRCTYSDNIIKLSTRVKVKVHEVNVAQKEITFELLEIIKNKELTRKKD